MFQAFRDKMQQRKGCRLNVQNGPPPFALAELGQVNFGYQPSYNNNTVSGTSSGEAWRRKESVTERAPNIDHYKNDAVRPSLDELHRERTVSVVNGQHIANGQTEAPKTDVDTKIKFGWIVGVLVRNYQFYSAHLFFSKKVFPGKMHVEYPWRHVILTYKLGWRSSWNRACYNNYIAQLCCNHYHNLVYVCHLY